MGKKDRSNKVNKQVGHPLISKLLGLRGNTRACVYTEPMFGIPYNLYLPYFTVYQYALGLDDRLIGIILSIHAFFSIFGALFGGIITDKLGRRLTTFVFDTIAWSIPLLLWTFARSWEWFVVAAIINSGPQITMNSFTCLMVEDADPDDILAVHTWVNISGLMSVFFAPLSGLLVARMGVVPAMRILLFITVIMLTTKFVLLYFITTETEIGKIRREQTKHESFASQLRGYKDVWKLIWHTPQTRLLLFIFVILNLTQLTTNNFLSLFLTLNLGVPESLLALWPLARAAIMLLFIFTIKTWLDRLPFRIPMSVGLLLYAGSQILLIAAPPETWTVLILAVIAEATGAALVMPQRDALLTHWVDPNERARINSVLYVLMLAMSTPFGWIAGEIATLNRRGVFALNLVLYIICLVLIQQKPEISGARSETEDSPAR